MVSIARLRCRNAGKHEPDIDLEPADRGEFEDILFAEPGLLPDLPDNLPDPAFVLSRDRKPERKGMVPPVIMRDLRIRIDQPGDLLDLFLRSP